MEILLCFVKRVWAAGSRVPNLKSYDYHRYKVIFRKRAKRKLCSANIGSEGYKKAKKAMRSSLLVKGDKWRYPLCFLLKVFLFHGWGVQELLRRGRLHFAARVVESVLGFDWAELKFQWQKVISFWRTHHNVLGGSWVPPVWTLRDVMKLKSINDVGEGASSNIKRTCRSL